MRHAGPFATEVQSQRATYRNRKSVFRALGDICMAYMRGGSPVVSLDGFKASELGQENLQSVEVWRGFVPFLQLPPAARLVCYTTNSTELVSAWLRKAVSSRGKVPSYTAALKMLWVKICNIEDRCVAQRAKKAKCDIECNSLIEGAKAGLTPGK